MKIFLILFFVGLLNGGVLAQIGIKTHRPVSGSLVTNGTVYDSSVYAGNNIYPRLPGVYPQAPGPVDPITLYMNRTRAQMATGVCFKEVPTATLVEDKSRGIPTGNASDPTMSVVHVCCNGYERNVHNFLQCDPICSNGCPNGICVAPEQCKCYPDSIKNLAGFCIPTCPIGCGNGECQPDGTCRCKPGFLLEPTQRKFCIPLCSQGCLNGNCTAPDVCECNSGYGNTPTGACEARCDKCENGRCVGPGNCQCNPGYAKKEGRCEAVCSKGCNNGICAGPEVCQCRPGWTLDPTGTNCIAHCERACLNGYCSGSNACSCNPGYIQDPIDPFMCIPNCQGGCPNGVCTAPNVCLCRPGYVKDRGVKGRQQCVPAV